MFGTFRQRLLFWFMVFISSSLIIILLSITYLQKREQIFSTSRKVELGYFILLKNVKAQQDFFSYETKSTRYFQTQESNYLNEYTLWLDSSMLTLNSVHYDNSLTLDSSLTHIINELKSIDSLFNTIVKLINERGFKDYSLEGKMRDEVHWLENVKEIPKQDILTLRRHEKDFMIRNDVAYVNKLTSLADTILFNIRKNVSINDVRKDSITHYLSGYKNKFATLVELDKLIGIKDNSGLKRTLDLKIAQLEAELTEVVLYSRKWAERQYRWLTIYFGILATILLASSMVLSAFIANRITQPLTELTTHISQFVESNFTLESSHPIVKSKDEVGKLTQNFSVLKNEVISRLKFFKQKVDEQTANLAEANLRLQKLNESNSRFVPKEFLDFLGRDNITQVMLGDHVKEKMTIMFTDIRDFTKLSESLTPQQNFDLINEYLNGIVPIIKDNNGFIDKFIGDSVMALFPIADHALKSALEFSEFLKEFNKKREIPIQIGTGIHTGDLILGTIGHDRRLETTVISDAVNTAARVEGLNKRYLTEVVATKKTINNLNTKGLFNYRFLEEVAVKGKRKTISVYEILSEKQPLKLAYLDSYNEGVKLVEKKDMTKAKTIFEELQLKNKHDVAVDIFLNKCNNYLKNESKN